MIETLERGETVIVDTIPRMGDCPSGGDHERVAENTKVGIIYTCKKCGTRL